MTPAHVYYLLRMRYLVWRAGVAGGEGARCFTRIAPLLTNDGKITIGKGLRTDCFFAPTKLHAGKGGHLEIGNHVYINSGAQLSALLHVKVGDETQCLESPGFFVRSAQYGRWMYGSHRFSSKGDIEQRSALLCHSKCSS